MLSLFPSLLDYNALAVTVLRIVVAVIFITEGYRVFFRKEVLTSSYRKFLSLVELIGGIFLFAGLFTQAMAIILGAVSLKKTYLDYRNGAGEERHIPFYFLLFIVSASFLFFGPGLWSIDYPL
jgi:uncharacterized membrane protein YphA (DoxX/SURF4 family)